MNRRDCFGTSAVFALLVILSGCTVAWEDQKSPERQRRPGGDETNRTRSGGRRSGRQSGPSDIQTLSKLLQKAGYPLTEPQINYLLKLEPGPAFTANMNEVLDPKQVEAVKAGSSGRRRGGRR